MIRIYDEFCHKRHEASQLVLVKQKPGTKNKFKKVYQIFDKYIGEKCIIFYRNMYRIFYSMSHALFCVFYQNFYMHAI